MKKNVLFLLSCVLLLIMACAITESTSAPVTVPTSAPPLNTPVPQQPAVQNPTSLPATAADASVYLEQLNAGAAYDFDTFSVVQDASADFSLDADAGLMQPQNGGQMSGYADLSPFEKSECQTAVMSTDPLAWQSDLYICFKTNQGRYGYIVIREAASDAIWFDAYLFP